MNTDYLQFKYIDDLIRAAKISEAEKLVTTEVKKIRKRSDKLIFAEFARRKLIFTGPLPTSTGGITTVLKSN